MNSIVVIPSRTNKINPKLRQKTGQISGIGGKLKVGGEGGETKKIGKKAIFDYEALPHHCVFFMQFSKGNGALKCFYGTIIKYSPHISAQ